MDLTREQDEEFIKGNSYKVYLLLLNEIGRKTDSGAMDGANRRGPGIRRAWRLFFETIEFSKS